MKVCLITNIIPPYRLPLFESIGKRYDLTVLVSARMESNRWWKAWDSRYARHFRSVCLSGWSFGSGGKTVYFQPSLLLELRKLSCDVIVNSGFGFNTLLTAVYGRTTGKRLLFWSEATVFSARNANPVRRFLRKIIVRMHHGFIPSGKEATEYLRSLGAGTERCFTAVDAVDTYRNSPDPDRIERKISEIGSGIAGIKILYSGRFVPGKGLDLLLKAFSKIRDRDRCALILMGGGPDEIKLRRLTSDLNLQNVVFAGMKDETEKWAYYLASDMFVFPTLGDVWGLVLNEAMQCGLPVICSPFAGAAADLVCHGENGYIADPRDIGSLTRRMDQLTGNESLRREMGRRSLEIIQSYSIAASAEGFFRAITNRDSDASADRS
ncbi:glycosyltransferase family 4 protein [bacterium]|nr:glycosyltransferase family 4 protein [candidate division CSSED10-310 bacterium]